MSDCLLSRIECTKLFWAKNGRPLEILQINLLCVFPPFLLFIRLDIHCLYPGNSNSKIGRSQDEGNQLIIAFKSNPRLTFFYKCINVKDGQEKLSS